MLATRQRKSALRSAVSHGPDAEVAARVLSSLPTRDREILIRFYLNLQDPAELQNEFGITEAEFRQIKTQARGLFRSLRAQMACQTDYSKALRPLRA